MIYQVRANLYFNIEDEAIDFYHDCELAYLKSTVVNPGQLEAEYSSIQRILSNHDLDPNQPSVLLESNTNEPPPP